MKSTSRACNTSASTKCPMRTLAITGIVTVAIISRITLIDAMRATPPSLRMSEGTRSSAMTAQAPAFSAILACSALVTSMMTPPLSISARPTLTRHSLAAFAFPFPLPFTFFESISLLLWISNSSLPSPSKLLLHRPILLFRLSDNHEPSLAPRQNIPRRIPYFADLEQIPSALRLFKRLDYDFFLHIDWFYVVHGQLRGDRPRIPEPAYFSHRLIQHQRDDPTMSHATTALIARS